MSRLLLPSSRRIAGPLLSRPPRGLATSSSVKPSVSALMNWPATQMSVLPNGVRVATEQTQTETATFGVWYGTGSRYETKRNSGVAHFMEHLFFKGTTRRSRRDIEIEIENAGAHLNAYTSRESTVFYVKTHKGGVDQSMDVLADMLQNSTFSQEAVDAERHVILREAQEIAGMPDEVVFDDLHATAFQTCSLGQTILGPEDNINSLTSEDIKAYHRANYVGENMVVCGAGPFEHAEFAKLVEKHFTNIPFKTARPALKQPARFVGSDIRVRYDEQPLAHIALAFPTGGWNDPDMVTLQVLQSLLGSWSEGVASGSEANTSLVRQVVQGNLARSISSFLTPYNDVGLFGVYAVGEEKALAELTATILRELVRFSYELDPSTLEDAKKALKLQTLVNLDGTTPICEEIGRQISSHGRRIHPLETLARIDAVDVGAIKDVINRCIYDRDLALAAHGPLHGLPDYNELRKRTYWYQY